VSGGGGRRGGVEVDERSEGEADGRDEERHASAGRDGERERRDGHEADRHVDAGPRKPTYRSRHRVVARRGRARDDDDRHRDQHREQRDER